MEEERCGEDSDVEGMVYHQLEPRPVCPQITAIGSTGFAAAGTTQAHKKHCYYHKEVAVHTHNGYCVLGVYSHYTQYCVEVVSR